MQAERIVRWRGNVAPAPPIAPKPLRPRWPAQRLAAVENLWGVGFTSPGGAPETLRLGKPIGLTSNVSLLLLGGGLGGPAQAIVENYGAWVASFEADAELAHIAEQRRADHPSARRMQVARWDPAQPSFGRRNAHHAMTLEAMRGGEPEATLESLALALRPQGHLMLTELVADGEAHVDDAEFAAWCRLRDRSAELPRLDQVTTSLSRLGFDVRIVEDMSDRHASATLAGWRAAVNTMAAGPRPGAPQAAAFVSEAEQWLLRLRLMRKCGLRLMRWHAIASA